MTDTPRLTAEEIAEGLELRRAMDTVEQAYRDAPNKENGLRRDRLIRNVDSYFYAHAPALLAAAEREAALRESTAKWADAASKAETTCLTLIAERDSLRAELAEMRERKDTAYAERNRVVAALATLFPSGTARTAIEGWSDDWHGCVYIDLPTGQVSWHFHDSQAGYFADLPPYTKPWDGHDTAEKYRRLDALRAGGGE